ncbi:MAGUK p55 subfamily member 6 [Holothuria leucospilota]|uniref:MAGUK p55 subfamily member 6 n=1 Tax=Holothuria leucospilota TaxID=206669 RepID=A0A9Q0YBK5_HOLLE|nr:MAGUK p55 subfamily member 6 [Holothuria leucospilota]
MLPPPPPIYLRAFFDYKPQKDALLPCGEVGLSFDKGDVLCVVDRSDPDWWQAYIVGKEGTCGLIPSEELEERRRAFVPSDHLHTKRVACGLIKTKKKKKSNYETRKNYQFDKSDIISYEEVQEMPPFHRKTLILIGAQGVGRRVIVNQLTRSDPDRFGCAVPSTSRQMKEGEEDGISYNFVSRKDLEDDIINNQLLEYGEFMGNIYGTTFDAVRKVNKENKICILDVNPQTLKLLRNSEFLPFVVFVKSPSLDMLRAMHQHASRGTGTVPDSDLQKTVDESARIEQLYSHLFDFTIVNNHLEETCEEILFELENMETNRQWVPVTWVYDCP